HDSGRDCEGCADRGNCGVTKAVSQSHSGHASEGVSYTTTGISPARIFLRGISQWRAVRDQARNARESRGAAGRIQELQKIEASMCSKLGIQLKGLKTLEI